MNGMGMGQTGKSSARIARTSPPAPRQHNLPWRAKRVKNDDIISVIDCKRRNPSQTGFVRSAMSESKGLTGIVAVLLCFGAADSVFAQRNRVAAIDNAQRL